MIFPVKDFRSSIELEHLFHVKQELPSLCKKKKQRWQAALQAARLPAQVLR